MVGVVQSLERSGINRLLCTSRRTAGTIAGLVLGLSTILAVASTTPALAAQPADQSWCDAEIERVDCAVDPTGKPAVVAETAADAVYDQSETLLVIPASQDAGQSQTDEVGRSSLIGPPVEMPPLGAQPSADAGASSPVLSMPTDEEPRTPGPPNRSPF